MSSRPHIGLLVTCITDVMRPSIAFAAIDLLEQTGARVSVPRAQTCCGQPAFNAGRNDQAAQLARQTIEALEDYDALVAPSASCIGMIKLHYPELLAGTGFGTRARGVADKAFELTQYLTAQNFTPSGVRLQARAAYHDTCSALREVGVKDQPRALLAQVEGLEVVENDSAKACCGFGGTFSLKFPEISGTIAGRKAAAVNAVQPDMLIGGDLGCLMNIAGRMKRDGTEVPYFHIAEVLAGKAVLP